MEDVPVAVETFKVTVVAFTRVKVITGTAPILNRVVTAEGTMTVEGFDIPKQPLNVYPPYTALLPEMVISKYAVLAE